MWRSCGGYLARMGFQQAPTVTEPGEFAIRGGLIDLYPPGARGPVRLDLFGDVLESARRFDPETQRTTEAVKRVELAPVSEVILDEPAIERFRTRYRAMFGAAGRDDPLYEAISAGRKHQGYEHWLPFFHERLETLVRLSARGAGAARRPDRRRRGRRAGRRSPSSTTRGRWRWRRSRSSGRSTSRCRRASSISTTPGWEAAVAGRPLHQLSVLPQPLGPGVIDAGGRVGRDFAPERQQEAGEPLRRAGGACGGAAQARRGGDRQLLQGRAGAAGGAARRQRRDRRARDRAGGGDRGRQRAVARGLAAGARLRGAGADGDRRAGRARRPADPARRGGASARRISSPRRRG